MAEIELKVQDCLAENLQEDMSETKAQSIKPYVLNNRMPKDRGWAWMVMLGKYFT